ncbi:MAG: hypothetical protein NTZ42_03765 [Candidatus Gribaldobacteria bacterium]|nr:hypothetical protein [Candidatus Gribaldobacteria bacterium]
MKIIHYFNENNRVAKNVEKENGFLLTNLLGGYFWLAEKPTSRYQGWFFTPSWLAGNKIFRILENIEIEGSLAVNEIKNNFWQVERKRGEASETFFTPSFLNVLVYETTLASDIKLFFDAKESYNNQNSSFYEIFEQDGLVVIKCQTTDEAMPEFFVAIKANSTIYERPNQWIERNYSFDKNRNSAPFERSVYLALKFKNSQRLVLAVAQTKDQAIEQAQNATRHLGSLKKKARKEIKNLWPFLNRPNIKDPELKLAYLCAKNSLRSCLVFNEKKKIKGLYAGLPWFFQFWQRDTALCLTSLKALNKSTSQTIWQNLIRDIIRGEKNNSASDGWGWAIKRSDIFQEWHRKFLLTAIQEFEKSASQNLFWHGQRSTWMDTIDRYPATIELQALFLAACHTASKNFEFWRKKFFYDNLEDDSHILIKEKFWNGQALADGFNGQSADFTARPNAFLAYHSYPKLLTKLEWEKCFANLLPRLWLEWGGLATIDKYSPTFHNEHSGETPASYHQGDSWFFINNLAALVLAKANQKKFKPYIEQITKASMQDILWQGIVGHHSELSSARNLQAEGCLCQAWSSALFVELLQKLH